MIFRSPLPDVALPSGALTPYVLARAEQLGDKPALIDGPTGRTITYGQLDQQVRSLAGGLVSQGFKRGDVLALMAPNMPEYAVIFHAVAMAGGVITTINPSYTEHEVRHQLLDAGASMLVTVGLCQAVARRAAEGTGVKTMHVVDDLPESASEAGHVAVLPASGLVGARLAEQVPVDEDDVVVLPYSSGTTGVSKGVMLTHRSLCANIAQTIPTAKIHEGETFIAVLPFFHIYGMQVMMNIGLRAGVTLITMPRFDLEQFLALHVRYRITRSFVAPPIIIALARHPIVDNYDLSSVKQVLCAAAPLRAELALEAGAPLGCEVVQGYGMTELSPVSHLTLPGRFKPGSVGVTVPNTELRIVDPSSGQDLGIDTDGELWIRGPQVMKGYLNKPDATELTVDAEGWLRTGDIGHVDAEGHVFIVDRLKELIKYKGFQVAPAELEALLLTHPAVADAAVIGAPDEEAGEIPSAFVVLRPGAKASAEELQGFIEGQVAPYKKLRRVTFIDAVPKSASGKILRRLLRGDQPFH